MTIVDIGRMNPSNHRITYGIYYNRSLATLHQLTPVEPGFPGGFRCPLNGLAIDNPGTRILISTPFFSELPRDRWMDLLHNMVVDPWVIIVTY
jgi:hypothetical protein